MRRLSLRWVLLGTVLGAIAVAFAVFAMYLDVIEQANRLEDIDAELVRAERTGRIPPQTDQVGQVPPPQEAGSGATAADSPAQLLLDPDGAVLDSSGLPNPFDPTTLATLSDSSGNVSTSDPRFRVQVTRTAEGIVVTALPLDGFDAAVGRFRVALGVGGGVILALVAAMLWVLTGMLTRPLTRMADSARRIAGGDLETPVAPPAGTRETAELAVDLELMVGRLGDSIEEANRAREGTERLLADLAHEIRTPLTALKGYSDLYAQGMLEHSSDVDRAMSRIGSESERLNALADTMLQLAYEPSGEPWSDEIDVAEVAGEVVSDLRVAYPDQRLELDVDQPGPHTIVGSRDPMQQALLNLGSNACHYNPPGGTIVIAVKRDSAEVRISVTDQGPGVDTVDRDRIFEPFYRSDAARSRDGQHGAGLGLALVRQIAEQHHGTVSVESNAEGGATFVFSVPGTSRRNATLRISDDYE